MNDSLIFHTSDIIILNYPKTMNVRWHEGKSVGVTKQNHRNTDQAQKSVKFEHREIIQFQSFCDSLSINGVTSWTKYPYWFISL